MKLSAKVKVKKKFLCCASGFGTWLGSSSTPHFSVGLSLEDLPLSPDVTTKRRIANNGLK